MPGTTTRLALPYPLESEPANVGATAIQNLATKLDNAATFAIGTNAALPGTVPVAGSYYFASDVPLLYLSDGTTWQKIGVGGGVPIGTVAQFAGSGAQTAPAGGYWVPCDGTAYSRATYAAAFALTNGAAPWGVGNGTTTFNVPTIAAGTSIVQTGASFALGATGGEASHTLTLSETPQHRHNVLLTTDYPAVSNPAADDFILPAQGPPTSGTISPGSTSNDGSFTTYAGGGAAHNNMPPYKALTHLVRLA